MNRTQCLTAEWLKTSNLSGDQLLLEALLRRGFLAFLDQEGVFLGSGSHAGDSAILKLVDGIEIFPTTARMDRVAKIAFRDSDQVAAAIRIVALGENHTGTGIGHFTGFGVGGYIKDDWPSYKRMKWGTKMAVCPAQVQGQPDVWNALDTGIALLVKALPLARVGTAYSCDGHGTEPANIEFHFPWDPQWAEAVFWILGATTPGSTWHWGKRNVTIYPSFGYSDPAVLAMLHDLQCVSRLLLNQQVIDRIEVARSNLMSDIKACNRWGDDLPPNDFIYESRRCLKNAFYDE